MQGIIKVSPQLLQSTASEFQNQAAALRALTAAMMVLITGLAATWHGTASSIFIKKFKDLQDDIERMIRMIQEHCEDLRRMAQEYMRAENESADEANSLTTDVII